MGNGNDVSDDSDIMNNVSIKDDELLHLIQTNAPMERPPLSRSSSLRSSRTDGTSSSMSNVSIELQY